MLLEVWEMLDAYRDDLTYIHNTGFGSLAQAAGPLLVDELRQRGLSDGLVIDLGCGSGILSGVVSEAGFDVLGIDLSEAHPSRLWTVTIGARACRLPGATALTTRFATRYGGVDGVRLWSR